MGASDQRPWNALEADAHDGPSLILATATDPAWVRLIHGLEQQKAELWRLAAIPVQPALIEQGKNPLSID
jgi:hypothetical protein